MAVSAAFQRRCTEVLRFRTGVRRATQRAMVALWRPAANSLVRIRHERWRVQRSTPYANCVVLEVVGLDAGNRGCSTSFVLPFEVCESLSADLHPRAVSTRGWRRLVRKVLAAATPSPLALKSVVRARFDPLPFQLEPALAYVRGETTRLLIADAVGLGKTVQAGIIVAEMLERRRDGRALIVVPGGLREQWRDELRDRFAVRVDVLDSAGLWRVSSSLPPGMNPWTVPQIVVTSIDFIKRPEVLRALEPLVWDVVVFDEAHALCGHSDRRAAAAGLAARGRAVVLLTATPHSGDEESFERLRSLGDIESRFPLSVYRRTRADLGHNRQRRSLWLPVKVAPMERTLHERLVEYARHVWSEDVAPGSRLAMVVLLKRGASSVTALTRSLERRRNLLASQAPVTTIAQLLLPLSQHDDEEPNAELGIPGLADRERELEELDGLIAVGRSTSVVSAKVRAVRRLVRRTTEPIILFTQYRDTLDELTRAFEQLSIARIHGGMSTRERNDVYRAFAGGSVRVLIATDAASEGLNLHASCRLVVSFDLPWTPLRIEQRVGRVDRIGQTRRPHAWQMVASGTYEDIVADRVRARAATAAAAIDRLEALEERDAASAVLAPGADGTGLHLDPAPMPSTRTVSERSELEARRIITARMLAGRASALASNHPIVTRARNRRGHRVLLAYRLACLDPRGLHSWDCLVAIVGPATPDLNTSIERLLMSTDASSLAFDAFRGRLDDEIRQWRRSAAAVLRRDRAIASALRRNRAELSAALVQPELFSKRAERALTPQLQLLDASLGKLRAASSELSAVARIRVESASPVFAAVLPLQ